MDVKLSKLNKGLKGCIEIPSDKSISHRAAMFAMLTKGKYKIENYSNGADCVSTLNVIKSLGCHVEFLAEQNIIIDAKNSLFSSKTTLDCGNSGTTMRLMSGILSGAKGKYTLVGDESLSLRPMKRIIIPLSKMGACIKSNDNKAPLEIMGSELCGIVYNSNLASAQVKSAVLLAGLSASGETKYVEPYKSRNHTELLLKYLGADIITSDNAVIVKKSELEPRDITVCGDISSAAFFMVAASIVPNSDVRLQNVGLNSTRMGIINILLQMGANIEILNKKELCGEVVGDLRIKYSELKAVTIEGEIIPKLIDELPVIALLATQASGITVVKNAEELKNKETDRIGAVVAELRKLGADIEATDDGFIVKGRKNLLGGCELNSYRDHRIAMTLYVAGLICKNPIVINQFEWVNISFPEFQSLISQLM